MNYNYHDHQLEALGDVTNDSQRYFQTEKSQNELLPNSGERTIEDYSSLEKQFGKENKICPNSHQDSRLDTLHQMLNVEQTFTVDTKGNQLVQNSNYVFSGINSSVTGQLDSHTRESNELLLMNQQFQESREYNFQNERKNSQQSQQNETQNCRSNNFYKQSPEKQTIHLSQSDQQSFVSLSNLDQVGQNTLKNEPQSNSHGWIKRMYAGDNSANSNKVRRSLEQNSQNQSRGDIRCPRPRNNHSQSDQNEFDERSQQSLFIKNSFKQNTQENSYSAKPPIQLSLRHSSRAPSGYQTSIEGTEVEVNEKNIDYQQHPIKLSQFGDSSRRETDFDGEQNRTYEAEQLKNPPVRAFSEKCLSEPYQTDLQVQNSVFTQSSTHLIENNGYQTENEVNDSKHVTLAYGGGTENQNQTQNQNPIDQTQESLNRKQSVGHISFTSGQRQFSNWMTGKHQQYLKDLQLHSNFGQNLLQKVRPDQASSRIEIEETMSSHPVVYPMAPQTKRITQENDVRSLSSDILSGGQMQRSKITYLPQEISMEETETRSYAGLSDHRISRQPIDNFIKKQTSALIQNEQNYRNILNDLSTRTFEKQIDQNKYKKKTQLNMYRSFERQDNCNDRSLMNKQFDLNISNRTSDIQRDQQQENSEEPGPDRKAIIRQMVLKNSRNLITQPSQETNDQAVRLSQLFRKKEQITTKRQAQSISTEIPGRRTLTSNFADQNPDKNSQSMFQTSSGKVNIGVLRKLQQIQVERKSYDQVQFKQQTRQRPEELYILPVTSLSQSYDKTIQYKYGEESQDYKQTIDHRPTFSPVHTTPQQSFVSSVQKSRITRYKQIEREIRNERDEQQRQEELRQQKEEAYRQERASILRQHYQQQQMEASKQIYYQDSVQSDYQPKNERNVEQRKEIQHYNSKYSNLEQNNKIHSFANSPGLPISNFSVGIIAPGDHSLVNQHRKDTYQTQKSQFQSVESLKDSNFTLGGESEKNILSYQDWNDMKQPLIKRMGTAIFGEQKGSQQKLSQEQLNQLMSREVKNRYSVASFEHDFQEEQDSLLQNSSQYQIIRKPWNSRERNQCINKEKNHSSQNIQNDNLYNPSTQDDYLQNQQITDQSLENQSNKDQQKLSDFIQYKKEIQQQKEIPVKQYSQEFNQRREVSEPYYQPSIPQTKDQLDKQYKNYNRRSDSLDVQNNLSNSLERFPNRDIYAKKEINSQSQNIRVQDNQYIHQVQQRENNFQKSKPIEEPINQFYGQYINKDRQTIQQEKEAFIKRYEKLMQKQALIREQAAKFNSWKSDSVKEVENETQFDNKQRKQLVNSLDNNQIISRVSEELKFDHKLQSMTQTNHKQLIVQSIETNNNYQTDNIVGKNTYQSNFRKDEVVRSASPSPVTLTRMQLKSSFGQKAVNQAKNEHPQETSIERLKRLLPPHELEQLQPENQNTQKLIESFSPEVSFAPQQIHSHLSRVHYKLPDIEAKAKVDEVKQEVHKAVTNLNSTLESQGLLQQNQKSSNLDYQPVRMKNEKFQKSFYDVDYNQREGKKTMKVQSLKSLPEQNHFNDEIHQILSYDNNPVLAQTISSILPPKSTSAVESICYNNQPSKLSNYKQEQNLSENDDRSTQMQIKTVSSQKFEKQEQLLNDSSKMAQMRQNVMENQKVSPNVKELIHMQFLQAQMLMDLHKQFVQASAIEEGTIEYQTENADLTERSQNQAQDFSERSQQLVQNQESYESLRNSSQKQIETINSICKSMKDAEVQADYDFSVQSKSTAKKYFDKHEVQNNQDQLSQYDPKNLSAFNQKTQSNQSQYHKKTQSMQSRTSQQMQSQNSEQTQSRVSQQILSQRILSQTISQSKGKQNSSYKNSTLSYGSQQNSGQKSSQLLLNQVEVTVPQNQCPSQLKSQLMPKSIHDKILGNLSQQNLETRLASQTSLQFLDNSRNASTLQQPGFILSNRDTQQAILLNESQQRSSKTVLKSQCEASMAGLSQISQTKGKTLTLISKIYQMIEKIDKHVAAKEVLDEVRFQDMQKRMFKLARKYKALKEENQILLKSHNGDPDSYDSSVRGRFFKKHNFSIQDEESENMLKISEKSKGRLTERILPTHQ